MFSFLCISLRFLSSLACKATIAHIHTHARAPRFKRNRLLFVYLPELRLFDLCAHRNWCMNGRKSQQLYWKIAMAVVVMLITRFQCLIVIFINNIDCRSPQNRMLRRKKPQLDWQCYFKWLESPDFHFVSFDVFASPLCRFFFVLFSGLCEPFGSLSLGNGI